MAPRFLRGSLISELLTVPHFIEAKSKDELILKMIRNNVKQGITYKYFDIQKDGKKWIAWYLADARSSLKKRIENGDSKN